MNSRPRANILILSPKAPGQGFGGAERHLQDLALILQAVAASVVFRSRMDAGPTSWFERLIARIEPMLASPLAMRRQQLPPADIVLSVELMGVGVKHSRHLHLFFGSYAGFRDLALPARKGPYLLIWILKNRLALWLEKATQHERGALANSIGLRNVLRDRGIPVREEVLPPPTDCRLFCPGNKQVSRSKLNIPQNKRVLLFAGRWEYAKGADRIVEIFKIMPSNWHILIATPAEYSYEKIVGSNVTIMTDLDTHQMIEIYRAADILLQPSRFEGYSLVVSEAQACGCTTLTSPVGQAAHFIESSQLVIQSSVIFSPDDPQCWIAAIENIFADELSIDDRGAIHRQYALENVSFDAVQAKWQKFLSKEFEGFEWQTH